MRKDEERARAAMAPRKEGGSGSATRAPSCVSRCGFQQIPRYRQFACTRRARAKASLDSLLLRITEAHRRTLPCTHLSWSTMRFRMYALGRGARREGGGRGSCQRCRGAGVGVTVRLISSAERCAYTHRYSRTRLLELEPTVCVCVLYMCV